jgi:hypothetical protein
VTGLFVSLMIAGCLTLAAGAVLMCIEAQGPAE